ncbi:MAG: prolipoprotein diacylglyceryl transferase [Dehalococcoidia bacterium]|jgi:phosphatidylglycerol:prolipoprotein diacylglycerol transferase
MWNIDWNPVILTLGTLEIRWYGVMIVLAVVAAIGVSLLEARRTGYSQDVIWDVALWALIGGIVGARLLHIIDQWNYYMMHPAELLNFAGLAIWGAMLGALIAIVIYVLVKKISLWQLGDIAVPGGILGQAIGRVGCLINGCCYGDVCDLPIAVSYNNPNSYAPQGVPIYPTQLFHLIWNLIGFGILWLLRKRLKPQGQLFMLYFVVFGVGDFVIHFFREGEPFLFGLPQAQIMDILMVPTALIIFIVRAVRYKSTGQSVAGEQPNTSVKSPEG